MTSLVGKLQFSQTAPLHPVPEPCCSRECDVVDGKSDYVRPRARCVFPKDTWYESEPVDVQNIMSLISLEQYHGIQHGWPSAVGLVGTYLAIFPVVPGKGSSLPWPCPVKEGLDTAAAPF